MLASIIPVFLIILLGVAIRHYEWLPEAFFPSIEKFSYNIAFPALLFAGTARLSFAGSQVGELALATLLPTFIIIGVTLLAMLGARGLPAASRSSVVQGAMRPNTYFGLAVSSLFFDAGTAALVMLSLALCLPVVNVVSIIALSWWSGSKADLRQIARTLARNPIILSTLAGMLVSLSSITIPLPLMNTLDILGKAALCLGLVCVGSGLVFSLQGCGRWRWAGPPCSSWWRCRWWRPRCACCSPCPARWRWRPPSTVPCRPRPTPTSWPSSWAATRA